MKTVITYGTFDLLHYGHMNFLKNARALGDKLIVGLSTDDFNKIKGKNGHYPYEIRKEILSAVKYVDTIFPEEKWEQKIEDIKNYGADIFVMGDDWAGKFDFLKEYCEVVYIPRTEHISTTALKEMIK